MSSYKTLQIDGEVTVKRVEGRLSPGSRRWIILLMGLSGAGKSTFIESLGPKARLGISGNQLESVTQEIVAYQLVNVQCDNCTIYLLDTPGFCDRKLSEMRVVKMVEEWMTANNQPSIQRILFFDRITDIRIPGSKKRSMDIFKAITGKTTSLIITIVTTMWDHLATEESIKRANERYDALQVGYWQDFVGAGSLVHKFENTQESNLRLIDSLCSIIPGTERWFEFEKMQTRNTSVKNTPFGQLLHQNISERVDQLRQKCCFLDDELRMPSTLGDKQLLETLLKEKAEADLDLNATLKEMEAEFGPPVDESAIAQVTTPTFKSDVDDMHSTTARSPPSSQTIQGKSKPRGFFSSAKAGAKRLFHIGK